MEKQKKVKKIEDFSKSLLVVTDLLKSDEGYREGWKANIAMAYLDCERQYKKKTGKKQLNYQDKHTIANDAADYFLNLLCK